MARRAVYRTCFAVACFSGECAVHLGQAFRALGRCSSIYAPLVVLAQLPIALLWLAARSVFLASAAPCFAIARSGARS